jgi:phosphomannomutase
LVAEHFSWFFGKRGIGHGVARHLRVEGKDEVKLPPLVVDCSNGVGARSMEALKKKLAGIPGVSVPIELRNTGTGRGRLNHNAGAEHVQKTRSVPENVDGVADRGKRFAAIDGDADRLVYFFPDPNSADVCHPSASIPFAIMTFMTTTMAMM